ncbi:MAG: PEP-CTERM sorting domain-containing protein [Bryobacteraceae bacterium]
MANASFILDPIQPTIGGSGLGSQNTILTIHDNDGTESGCVAWNGAADVLGSTVCGGSGSQTNEQSGSSQTQTIPVSAGGWLSSIDIGVIFNASEPSSDAIDLLDLVLYVFDADGTLRWNSGPFSPVNFASVDPGVGNAGFLFTLDAAQQLDLDTTVGTFVPDMRFGLSASVSDAQGGLETFFIADLRRSDPPPPPPPGPVPEPATWMLLGAGLIAAGCIRRRRA